MYSVNLQVYTQYMVYLYSISIILKNNKQVYYIESELVVTHACVILLKEIKQNGFRTIIISYHTYYTSISIIELFYCVYGFLKLQVYLCTKFYIPAIYYYTIYLNYINNLLPIYMSRSMCFSNNSLLIRRTRNRHLRHQLHIYNHNRNSNRNNSSTSNRGRRDRHRRLWTNNRRT